jgi:hypothetical protein
VTRYELGNVMENKNDTPQAPVAPTSMEVLPLDVTPAIDAPLDQSRFRDGLRAVIAGGGAARLIETSAALFEAGGKHVLTEGAQKIVRDVAAKGAKQVLAVATEPLVGAAAEAATKPIAALATSGVVPTLGRASRVSRFAGLGKHAARLAGKEVLKGAGKAAGIGLVIDGAVASIEVVGSVRDGTMDKKKALTYVAKEAATGAVATGAGVLLGAGLVALTGGAAAPVVFAVGAIGSIGTKRVLSRWTR